MDLLKATVTVGDGDGELVRRRLRRRAHRNGDRGVVEVVGVGVEFLDRAKPGVRHQLVAGRIRVESVVEVGRLALFEPVVAGDRRVHVEDGDLLSLRLLLLDDVGQVGVVRLDARVVRRGLAPHERGGDHVGGRLELVETVEELRRAPHVGERVVAGVVRAEMQEDDVRRLEHAAPGGQHLVDALPVAAVAVVDLPPAVALVVSMSIPSMMPGLEVAEPTKSTLYPAFLRNVQRNPR